MAKWAERLLAEVGEQDERARKLMSELSEGQLNWQPGPGRWSIGQCVEHLYLINREYVPAVNSGLEGKVKGAANDIKLGWLGGWFLRKFVEPTENTVKVKAPNSRVTPGSSVDVSVLERFLGENEKIRELIRRASEYDVNRLRFKNPFIPGLRFRVGTGLTIIVRHELRHLLQAERVRGTSGFPG